MKITLKLPTLGDLKEKGISDDGDDDVQKEVEGGKVQLEEKENINIHLPLMNKLLEAEKLEKAKAVVEGDVTREQRKLRPKRPINYNQRPPRTARKGTPVKTAAVSILPLPLGELLERKDLEEPLRHLESMEMNSMVVSCSNTTRRAEEGVRYVMDRGRMIREGDYVAVRGQDERVYFSIVYDVCLARKEERQGDTDCGCWPERKFRMRWLLPKSECIANVLGDPNMIRPEHFVLGPMHDGFESVENIVGVFFSPTEVPFATRWVSKATRALRPAPVVDLEKAALEHQQRKRREGLRGLKKMPPDATSSSKSGGRSSRMMQELEAAHLLMLLMNE